jgi:uncharacterized protein YceH (UPF0502 family)
LMEVEEDDVQEALDRLRGLGAVAEVQGGGRVPRYRHFMYEWLGVEKTELAVMTELLLRGEQTEGELRGRVARMEPIADLTALRGVLNSLKEKGLVISLSPEGRGHVVTHLLYSPRELERVKSDFQRVHGASLAAAAEPRVEPRIEPRVAPAPAPTMAATPAPAPAAAVPSQELTSLRREMAELAGLVAGLRDELGEVRAKCESQQRELDDLRRALGG